MTALLLLLVSAGVLLCSTGAQEAYSQLPGNYRKGVDLALQQLHDLSTIQHHLLFFKSLVKSDIEAGYDVTYIYHNFHLKPTKCPKGTADSKKCQFRDDRPLIDCAVCYKTFAGEIEQDPKPYIHCVRKPTLTEDMKTSRLDHCNTMGYSSGAPTLLATKGENTRKK